MRKNHSKIVCIKLVHLPYLVTYKVLKEMSMNITAFSDTMQCNLVYRYPMCAKVHSARSKKTVLVALVLCLSALTSPANIHFLIYALSFSV